MAARHEVRIVPQDRVVPVESGETVLAAALRAGLNLPHSCKSGHCGSCRARLLVGTAAQRGAVRPAGLSADEAAQGFVLLCQTLPLSDLAVEVRTVAAIDDVEIKSLPCRIDRLRLVAPDVMQVVLRLPAIETLKFAAGQYIDVLLEEGQRRSFSIASPPHDSERLELHVRLASGGLFTQRLFDQLREGTLLRIEGPLGQFAYRASERPLILVAGGTGFAPIKSILRHVLESGADRRIELYWGARTAVDLYEHAEVLEWAQRDSRLTYRPVLSRVSRLDGAAFDGPVPLGPVHDAVMADHADLSGYEVYAAGPPAMIEAIRAAFPARGLPVEHLHFDSFDYAPDSRTQRRS